MKSTLTKNQKKTFKKIIVEGKKKKLMTVTVRYDDECNNGHNSFSITGTIYRLFSSYEYRLDTKNGCSILIRENDNKIISLRNLIVESCGCIHKYIEKYFPELSHLIKWHHCSSEGPMHYVANTVYLAGDRDHCGLKKGEFRQHLSKGKFQNNGVEGVPYWEIESPEVSKIYSKEKPKDITLKWKPYGITRDGKDRELELARESAIWPEATNEELTAPGLEERLKARLPKLLEEFKKAIESIGFIY